MAVDTTAFAFALLLAAIPGIVWIAGRFLIRPAERTPYEELINQIHADADERRPLLVGHASDAERDSTAPPPPRLRPERAPSRSTPPRDAGYRSATASARR